MHMASSRSGGLLSMSKQRNGCCHVLHSNLSAPITKPRH